MNRRSAWLGSMAILIGFVVGCGSKDSDDEGGSGGKSGGSGGSGGSSKTSNCKLAGHWEGTLVFSQEGISLSIPAQLKFTKTGQVTLSLPEQGMSMAFEHEGQLIMSNPFIGSGTHASTQVTKLSATADKVVVGLKGRSGDVSADHRDPVLNDTSTEAVMTFTLSGDTVRAVVTESKVVDGKKSRGEMTGTFRRALVNEELGTETELSQQRPSAARPPRIVGEAPDEPTPLPPPSYETP